MKHPFMNFSEDQDVSILVYHPTKFELDQCTNNGCLLSDRPNRNMHTNTLNLIFLKYRIVSRYNIYHQRLISLHYHINEKWETVFYQ